MAAGSRSRPTATVPPARPGAGLHGIRLGRRAARGDRSAFEEIFERHHQELYRYCLAIVRDREDAEDALQTTMAAALRSLPGEERDIDVRPWLFRIAHNESISLLRRRSPAAVDQLEVPEREGASQEDRLETRDRVRRLVADLNELPERQCSALVMRELSGLSYAEIGDALACSEPGARQAVFEARTALREREEGREMECEEIRRSISDRDGRRLRGRKVRAHLSSCDGCSAFAAAIQHRRADLRSLCPPLPTAAAGTMLTGLIGGAGGGAATGVTAAGVAGGGIAASAAIKGGSIAAAIALAVGAADVSGLIDLPNPIGRDHGQPSSQIRDADSVSGGSPAAVHSSNPTGRAGEGDRGGDAGSNDGANGANANENGHGNGHGAGGSPENSPGNSADTPAASQDPGASATGSGNSSSSPGHTGSAPGGGSADAPGHTGEMPGNASTAPGQTGTAGNSSSAPGQTESAPSGQIDNPASANGNSVNAGPKQK